MKPRSTTTEFEVVASVEAACKSFVNWKETIGALEVQRLRLIACKSIRFSTGLMGKERQQDRRWLLREMKQDRMDRFDG